MEECKICFINKKSFIVLPCKHEICEECFKKWVIVNKTCPYCRNEFLELTNFINFINNNKYLLNHQSFNLTENINITVTETENNSLIHAENNNLINNVIQPINNSENISNDNQNIINNENRVIINIPNQNNRNVIDNQQPVSSDEIDDTCEMCSLFFCLFCLLYLYVFLT